MTVASLPGQGGLGPLLGSRPLAVLRVAAGSRSDRRLAATLLATICALTLLFATAPTASSIGAAFSESRVEAQTDTPATFVGLEALDSPVVVERNDPYSYDAVSGCCVAPRSTRVYSSGADALEGGAVSLDDAARVASENGIDMRAISLQYEGGAPSNLYGFTSMDGAGNMVRAPDGRYIVTLTDAGLSSPGSALNTIAHELNHIREISRTPGFHIPEEAGATLAGDLAELFMRGG